MKRAFSLLELLTCIGIILVVAGISFPAFAAVKQSAKVNAASSNLHQLYIGVALYRTDWGGDGVYGDPSAMGLPTVAGTFPRPFDIFMKSYQSFWRSPCGLNPDWYQRYSWEPEESPLMDIIFRPNDLKTYGTYASKYKQNSLLFYDLNCDDPDSPVANRYLDHRGLGVLIEGQLVNHHKPGSMWSDAWWSSPPGE